MNKDQLRAFIADGCQRKSGSYDRSADAKAWICYPCDDHAIRVYKETNGFWYARLTTMGDRLTTLEHAGPANTRAYAVVSVIKRVLGIS